MTGPEIIKRLSRLRPTPFKVTQSTLTSRVLPELKKSWGVENRPNVGYYIDRGSGL